MKSKKRVTTAKEYNDLQGAILRDEGLKNEIENLKQQAEPPKVSHKSGEATATAKHNIEQIKKKSQLSLFESQTKENLENLQAEVQQHRDAIKFLLSTNKHFQNEIQKEEIKKQTAQ